MKPFTTSEEETSLLGCPDPVVFYPAEQWGAYVALTTLDDGAYEYFLHCPMFKDGTPDRDGIGEIESWDGLSPAEVRAHIAAQS